MSDEKYTSGYMICRHPSCNNKSRFLHVGQVQHYTEGDEIGYSWDILICEICGKETIERQYTNFGASFPDPTEEDENNYYIERNAEVIYPPDEPKNISYEPSIDIRKLTLIARNVARAYQIAINTLSTEPVATGVFVRKTLESLCKDQGITDQDAKNLGSSNSKKGKLEILKDRGGITENLYKIANELKNIGNDVVHEEELNEISLEDGTELLNICEKILKHVYEELLDLKNTEEIRQRINSTKGKKI